MERVIIYQVIWASNNDPLCPSVYSTLDHADALQVYESWSSDIDEDEDYIVINTFNVPIPASLQPKFAIGT
jgi:hypothetical protein